MTAPAGATSPEALLRLYAGGDPRAAAALTQQLLPRVYRHALRMTGDAAEAEDVAQEAMLRLWRAAADWQAGEAQVTTWLYRVTANLCIDRLRRWRHSTALEAIPEPQDRAPGADARLQAEARDAALARALGQLPGRQRQAVVLRHLDGLSNPEIAAIMDISPRAVESLTARGKRALADMLAGRRAELGFEDDTE